METINIMALLKILSDFGTIGLVIFLWWHDSKCHSRLLAQYKSDMDEQRNMYEKNVSLVNDYHSVAQDLSSVVIMATQTMTRLTDEIRQNQYCPLIRIDKKRITIGDRDVDFDGKSGNARETVGG